KICCDGYSYCSLKENLMIRIETVIGALLLLLASSTTPFIYSQSQATTGTIQGFVKDESGAVVPGARVAIRHVQTGLTRELVTDSSGFYRGISLPSGTYEVTAGLDGFTTLKQSNIQLSIGQA